MSTPRRAFLLSLAMLSLSTSTAAARQDFDAVEVRVAAVRGGVQMITAAGGNLAFFAGPDGVLLVDADYGEMVDRILEAVRGLAPRADPPVRYLVNTHWHFDHTSGNENFVRAGATLIAHESVRRLLSEDQVMAALSGRPVPAAPEAARPTLTFNDRMNLDLNGEVIHLVHMPLAHTDGDIIVHFPGADVVHMGDIFFNGTYPFIDIDHGGNIVGMVRAVEEVLEHTGDSTLFIPGHGPLAHRDDLERYADMLRTARDRVQELIHGGASREEVIAAKPTADLDSVWAGQGSFLRPDIWVGLVYDGMVRGGSEF